MPWKKLLERPSSGGHFVQLYEPGSPALTQNVCHYAWEGIRRGDGVLMITTPEHRELFSARLERLGADLPALLERGQLVFLDARETLSQFMVSGKPLWRPFEKVIRGAVRKINCDEPGQGLRAYGEMVGLLWKAGQFAAAVRLEQLWNRLMEHCSFSLYCAYAIDVFGGEFKGTNLDGVLCTHTHMLPSESAGTLERALDQSMQEILGPSALGLRAKVRMNPHPGWAMMPNAERMILWLRKNLPEHADEIVARVRDHCSRAPDHDTSRS
jgi:hypothetical protein